MSKLSEPQAFGECLHRDYHIRVWVNLPDVARALQRQWMLAREKREIGIAEHRHGFDELDVALDAPETFQWRLLAPGHGQRVGRDRPATLARLADAAEGASERPRAGLAAEPKRLLQGPKRPLQGLQALVL